MLDEALAGAAHVRAANEAYGMLISPLFVPALNAVQDHAIGEIKNAVTATQGLAEQLRTVAAAYDLSDAEGARRLGGK